jgi:hypothetical protein
MRGIRVEEQSSIAYGEQLRLSSLGEKATLNLYWSARKGISFVIGAKPGSGIKAILETIRDQTELDLQDQAPELAKTRLEALDRLGRMRQGRLLRPPGGLRFQSQP